MQENEITAVQEPATEEENTAAAEKANDKLYSQEELDERIRSEREALEKKLAEAEKLSAMSEKDRGDYKRRQLEKELAEREAAVARRELMADAAERLEAAGLPKQLTACLNYSGREECETSLEAVGRAFESAVTSAVNERLSRGGVPKFAPTRSSDAFLDGLGM